MCGCSSIHLQKIFFLRSIAHRLGMRAIPCDECIRHIVPGFDGVDRLKRQPQQVARTCWLKPAAAIADDCLRLHGAHVNPCAILPEAL
jgi:hypothetical protein